MATSSSYLTDVSPHAERVSRMQAWQVNAAAAMGLSQVLQSNLGPTGTLKLLVGGTIEQLKLTKDGYTLLKEMQIQHPTAALLARTATAQDDVVGDGTTTTVLLTAALLQQAYQYMQEGLHPRVLADGYDLARDACLEFLKKFVIVEENVWQNKELLVSVARTSLGTKIDGPLVEQVRVFILSWYFAIAETIQRSTYPLPCLMFSSILLPPISHRHCLVQTLPCT
jgi:T-complex protein 1 subunit zeta